MEFFLATLSLSFILLILSLLRISENGFFRLNLQSFEGKKLGFFDALARKFVQEPVFLLISFNILKLVFIIAGLLNILFLMTIFFELNEYLILYVFTASLVLYFIFLEWIPFFFLRSNALMCFKMSFFLLLPLEWGIRLFFFFFPFSRKHYSDRLGKKDVISLHDIGEAIAHAEMDNKEEEVERQWIKGVLNFRDLEVSDVMRARLDIVAINATWSFQDVLRLMINAGYSRFPVYEDNLDNIIGVIYLKDLISLLPENQANWKSKIREPFFVPENLKLSKLLISFQQRKIHMAIVVDEYGSTSGLVTMEDILEEIVGEIDDEHDQESDQIYAKKVDDDTYIFDAKIPLHDFLKITHFPDDFFDGMDEEVETLAGVLLLLNGDFPSKNQIIPFKNVTFTVLSMFDYRIGNVKMTIQHEDNKD
ncbi:MAG: CBS domain-containing protein [Bacteroidales bacterium]|nr:CBS domain-containing protein [Bacteroidales bacterium]